MKKMITVLMAAAVLAGVLLLTGCGAQHDEALFGTWRWEDNTSYYTVFNEDGTGRHSTNWTGYGTTFNWRTSGNDIIWSYPGISDRVTRYTVSGGVWTFTLLDGSQIRYIR